MSLLNGRLAGLTALAALAASPALAQATPPAAAPPAAPPAAAPAPNDPVLAIVNGQEIHASDVAEAAQSVPEQMRSVPPNVLYPMVLDQLIDRKALVAEAQKMGLPKDPAVQRQITRAEDQALQNALLSREIGPSITEAAIKAKYDADYANKPAETEIHAHHILVATEDEAKQVIAELKKGGDFAALAKQHSTDPGGQQGGDLGWFKKSEMVPEFADAAFALKPGETSQTPVKTQFGWHVIHVDEVRQAPPPTLEQVHDEIRQQLISEGVQKVLTTARADVKIERFNMDGTPVKPTDTAVPPPAPAAKASPVPPAKK
jgi:peptidyl-prolyl cis-trans isomerase C